MEKAFCTGEPPSINVAEFIRREVDAYEQVKKVSALLGQTKDYSKVY